MGVSMHPSHLRRRNSQKGPRAVGERKEQSEKRGYWLGFCDKREWKRGKRRDPFFEACICSAHT